jgi:hypothetical protein
MQLTFVEHENFTREMQGVLCEDDVLELMIRLLERPEAGDVIPGGGGLRKIRVAASGRGKRGGARVIYYWFFDDQIIEFLSVYPKNRKSNLTADDLKKLRKLIE